MINLYFSILGLYIFGVAGFVLKKIFKEELNTKSLVLVTVYIMQPILGFWGFTKAPLIFDMLGVGILHFLTAFFITGIIFGIIKFWIKDSRKQAILAFTGTSGNTGNIGIPLATMLGGPTGVVVATMINFWNIIWNFIFGVYFYAKGEFSIKKSILEIFKLPLLWACFLGIILNINSVDIPPKIEYFLELGAYCSIVMQLLLLGIFMESIEIKKLDIKISGWIALVKFIFMPIIGFFFLWGYQQFFGEISQIVFLIAMLQLVVPLATNNGNLAVLYNCYPKKVSEAIFISYLIFLLFVPAMFYYWIY